MITQDQAREVLGSNAVTLDGDKLGSIGQIYLDDQTGEPEWATVKTGLFGTKESFVPLAQASLSGDNLTLPYNKDQITNAPRVEAEAGHLSQQEEAELYTYYGLEYDQAAADTLGTDSGYAGTEQFTGTETNASAADTGRISDESRFGSSDNTGTSEGTVGYDTSGPTTDNAMTRSEEQLNVGTETVEAGRARLRKYIVTENVTTTVPVSREEVRIEREPITDANVGDAMSGPDLSEEEHEVVLTEERPVVQKEAVPVERVRLDTDTVTENVEVTEEVRKEQIDMDGATTTGRTDADVYPEGDATRSTTDADRLR
jgi:uncharacterized protein (TIGR02271 family)